MSPLNGAHQIKFRMLFHRLIRLMWCIEFLIFTKVEKQVCNFFLTTTNQISYYCSKNMWAAKGKKKKGPTGKTQILSIGRPEFNIECIDNITLKKGFLKLILTIC